MPAPWETSPKDKWKNNFKGRIAAMVSNVGTNASENDMAAGLARLPDMPDQNTIESSTRFDNWTDAVDSFTEEAVKRMIVSHANGVPYDQASVDQFDSVLNDLADKYQSNFASAWE